MKTIQFEGKAHQFPDDFTDDEISEALSALPAPPSPAMGLYKSVDAGAAKAAAGVAGLPKTISDLGAGLIQKGVNKTADFFGRPDWRDERDLSKQEGLIKLPTSEEAAAAIQRDLYGGAEPYQPQNKLERYAETGGEFLGNAIMPGGALTRAASVVVPAAATEAVKAYGGGALPQAAAGLAGGLGVTATANALARRAAAKATPAFESLASAATKDYDDAAALGVTLAPTAVTKGMAAIETKLAAKFGVPKAATLETTQLLESLGAKHAPGSAPLARMTGVGPSPRAPVSVDEIKLVREQLGNLGQGPNATERMASRIAQKELDDFLATISKKPGAVVTGDADEAARLFESARGNYAAMKRADIVAGRMELGELNAATAGSGANVDNATRQAVKQLVRPDAQGKIRATKMGFSPEEIEQMKLVARGSKTSNTARYVGNLLAGGGGAAQMALGGAVGTAAAMGSPEYLPLLLAGRGAKGLSGKLSQRQVDKLDQMVRTRSPLGQQQITAPVQPLSVLQGAGYGIPSLLADPSRQQLLFNR